jgi:hypothetical protein
MWLQKSDPTFNMGVDVTRPVFNLEPKYRVTVLTTEEWTRGHGTPSMVNGLVWFTNGSRTVEETWVGAYRQSVGIRLSLSLGKHATVFQAVVYTILGCFLESETQNRPDKYDGICSDSQVALNAGC